MNGLLEEPCFIYQVLGSSKFLTKFRMNISLYKKWQDNSEVFSIMQPTTSVD